MLHKCNLMSCQRIKVWILWKSVHKSHIVFFHPVLAFLKVCLGWYVAFLKNVLPISNPIFLYAEQSDVVQMDTYWSASILPSTSVTLPTSFQPIQPYTMMFPPPNVKVPWTSISINLSTTCFHTDCSPYDPMHWPLSHLTKLASPSPPQNTGCASEQRPIIFPLFTLLFFFVTAFKKCYLSTVLAVYGQSGWELMTPMSLVTWTVLAAFPVVMWVRIDGREPGRMASKGICWLGRCSWIIVEVVCLPGPSGETIWQVGRLLETRERMFSAGQRRWDVVDVWDDIGSDVCQISMEGMSRWSK